VYLKRRNATEDTVEAELHRFKEERRKNVKQEDSEVQEVISRVRASRPAGGSRDEDDDDNDDFRRGEDDDDDDTRNVAFSSPAARGRGRGSRRPSRGRGESSRRGGRGRGGRGRASSSSADEPPSSSSRGGRASRTIKDAFSVISSKRSHNMCV